MSTLPDTRVVVVRVGAASFAWPPTAAARHMPAPDRGRRRVPTTTGRGTPDGGPSGPVRDPGTRRRRGRWHLGGGGGGGRHAVRRPGAGIRSSF